MKSYLQGIITGGALVFATIVFMGSTKSEVKRNDRREIAEYFLIRGEGLEDFNVSMNKYIGAGWKPYGYPFQSGGGNWFYQTIVNYKEDK